MFFHPQFLQMNTKPIRNAEGSEPTGVTHGSMPELTARLYIGSDSHAVCVVLTDGEHQQLESLMDRIGQRYMREFFYKVHDSFHETAEGRQ